METSTRAENAPASPQPPPPVPPANFRAAKRAASRLVATLNDEKSPFCSGTLKLEPRALVVFYGRPGPDETASRIDFGAATACDLEKLGRACDPATFGRDQEDVLDETYRKAGKLDAEHFSLGFDALSTGLVGAVRAGLLRRDERRPVIAELYKLNVYGKESFFKAHQDTPRAANMFGSLVVALPAPHEGGALLLRHQSQEWRFDSAKIFADLGADATSHIAFVTFYSDVEHEVLPVTSGHRVTITWNLYYGQPSDTPGLAPGLHILEPVNANETNVEGSLRALLANPHVLPDGGLLGFGLRYEYPMDPRREKPLEDVQRWLKGSDTALYRACADLGLAPALRFVALKDDVYGMFDRALDLTRWSEIEEYSRAIHNEITKKCGGVLLRHPWARLVHAYDRAAYEQTLRDRTPKERYRFITYVDGGDKYKPNMYREWSAEQLADVKVVYWVTARASGTTHASHYVAYGNQASLDCIYASVCLIAEVPPAAQRMRIVPE